MVSVTVWRTEPAAPSSRPGAPKAGNVSPPDAFVVRPLTGRRAFARVLAGGERHRRGTITVVSMANSTPDSRVGLVVGRRVGGAVDRNRAKRRIRHALRGKVPAGFDLVVVAGNETLEEDFQKLETHLSEAISLGTRRI